MTTTIEYKDTETLVNYIFATADLHDLIASQCSAGGYQAKLLDDTGTEIDNPVTDKRFAWDRIKNFAINELMHYRKKIKIDKAIKNITVSKIEVTGLTE